MSIVKGLEGKGEQEGYRLPFPGGAEFKIIRQQAGGTKWYGTLGTTYGFAAVNGSGNIEFKQSGTYNFYLNLEGQIYLYKHPDPTTDVTVNFSITKAAGYGNAVYIIGDFCDWNAASGVRLSYSDGDVWTGSMTKPQGTEIAYKFVTASYDNPSGVTWEGGNNRSLTFDTNKTVKATWQ